MDKGNPYFGAYNLISGLFCLLYFRAELPVQAENDHFHEAPREKVVKQFFVIQNSFFHPVQKLQQ